MGFFDFNQNEILPYSKSNAAKKDSRIQESLKAYNDSLKTEKEINLYKEQVQADLLKEQNAKNLVNARTLNRKRMLQENIKLEKNLIRKTLSAYLAEMVYSSLIFDEEFLVKQKGLKKSINNYIDNMFTEGVITEDSFINNGNLLMETAYCELTDIVKDKIKNKDIVDIFSESIIDDILTEAKKSKNASDEVADTVKEKVEDTIKQEKKISKKKEEEKEDEKAAEEMSDAADSLEEDENTEGEESDENDEAELDELDKKYGDDSEEGSDEEMSDEDLAGEDGAEGSEDMSEGDEVPTEAGMGAEGSEDMSGEADSTEGGDPNVDVDAEQATGNTMEITIKTDGKNVAVNANQSESTEYLNIFGKSRYEERNSKSLFRNLLEGNILYQASILTEGESNVGIKMDLVLAETVTQYTLLETMFTSKIFNLSPSQVKSIMKTVNFNRK